MTCSECQVQIYDGELSRDALAHLSECEECHALDREVRVNSAALAELRHEALPLRVAPIRRWLAYVALAASVLIAVAVGSYDDSPEFPEPRVPMVPPRVVQEVPAIPPLVLPGPPPVAKARPAKAAPKKEEPLLVKFLTDDPEVVIYWLIDPVQGEQAL